MTVLRRKLPWDTEGNSPEPLTAHTERWVRFEEVDPLGIVWHGRYSSYFEDGRTTFGDRYGLGYLDMYQQGFLAPITQLHVDYHNPLRLFETFRITTKLHYCEAVKFLFSYEIENNVGLLICSGHSIQLMTDLEMRLMLVRNGFLEDFWRRWREGRLHD